MDENYIDIVRKSLYGKDTRTELDGDQKMPRASKKIKFSVNKYNSENVFTDSQPKLEKIRSRKPTPYKKKSSKKYTLNTNDASSSEKIKHVKNKLPKKRKLLLSFSSVSSSEENTHNDVILSPSKSELELFQNNFKKSRVKKTRLNKHNKPSISSNRNVEYQEDSIEEFNLDTFFNTREHSFNESITEAHSGIDHEFVRDEINDFKIIVNMSVSETNEATEKTSKRNKLNSNKRSSLENKIPKNMESAELDCSDNLKINNGQEVSKQKHESKQNNETYTRDDDVDNQEISHAKSINISKNKTREQKRPVIPVQKQKIEPSIASKNTSAQQNNFLAPINNRLLNTDNLNNNQQVEKESLIEYGGNEDYKAVTLRKNATIYFHGLFTLRVLTGKVEILGSVLNETSNEVKLYSPRGSALLYVRNALDPDGNNKNDTYFHCIKLKDFRIQFIEKYISQQIFPKVYNNQSVNVIFEPTEQRWNKIEKNLAWDTLINEIKASTKLLITGGKGVGKSTFLRYAINGLLNRFDEVRVIDLDPGQSEFTVPGCVSIVTVKEPIFGPNYTHLIKPVRSLLSNINVGHEPEAYIRCVRSLVAYADTLKKCPTLINYMGFVQGIGLNIVSSVISYIKPTDILQIYSENSSRNFREDLTADHVRDNCNLFTSNIIDLDYSLHKIRAINDCKDGWTLEPRQVREMCVLSYFGQMMSEDVDSLTSHKLPMYEINFSSVKITNLQKEELNLAAVNASLVALCALDEMNIFHCFGYGIIRGIDLETETIVVITPESPEVLEKVYYLVLGSVSLPPSVYMTPDEVTGSIPYVSVVELVSLGQITKRSYIPPNKK